MRAKQLSVLLALALPTALALIAQAAVATKLVSAGSEFYQQALSLRSIVVVFFGIVPGIPFALRQAGLSDAGRNAWVSLALFWAGAATVITSAIFGKIHTGLDYLASYGVTNDNRAILGVSLGLLLAGFGCLYDGRSTTAVPARAGYGLWVNLVRLSAVMQSLVLASQVVLFVLIAIGSATRESSWVIAVSDPSVVRHLFWFSVQPMVLSAIFPVFGFVTLRLDALNTARAHKTELILQSAVAFSLLAFATWGIQCADVGQSARVTALFFAVNLLLLVPLAIPIPIWFSQIRNIPSGFRKQAGLPLVILTLMVAAICVSLPLMMPLQIDPRTGQWLQSARFHLLGIAVATVVVNGRKAFAPLAQPPKSADRDSRQLEIHFA